MGRARELAAGILGLGCIGLAAHLTVPRPALGRDATTSSAPSEPPSAKSSAKSSAALPDPVVDHRFDVRLRDRVLHGEGTVRWRNTSRLPQSVLWVHLYLNAFRDGRSLFRRADDGHFRGARAGTPGRIEVDRFAVEGEDLWPAEPHSPGDPDDATDIEVPLPRAVAPGETLEIELKWRSTMPALQARTGYFESFVMAGQWFPKLARLEPDGTWVHFRFHPLSEFYADFGRYDVTIDVPEGVVVGATGEEREPHRFVAEGVHDFAFAAWDRFVREVRTLPGGTRLEVLHPPGLTEQAAAELDAVADAMPRLEAAYGAFPYPKLTIVHPPAGADAAGGMEYPTLITTGRVGPERRWGARTLEAVTVHELAHQWFYGLVASNEHRWPFLDEGLTTYATMRALEARYPAASAFSGLGMEIGLPATYRFAALATSAEGPIARAADQFDGSSYATLVYYRAATLLETLRRVYGAPVERAVSRYARRGRFGHPTPTDLIDSFAVEVGEEAAEQLRRGLFDEATSDVSVVVEGDQVRVEREGTLAFPVEVEIVEAKGRRRVRWKGEPIATEGLVAATVDPDHRVLLDRDLRNNGWKREPSPFAPRVLSIGGAVAALVAGWGLP